MDTDQERSKVNAKEEVEVETPKSQHQLPMLAGLREKDVGITEYISKHEGFFGILKQRLVGYSFVCLF